MTLISLHQRSKPDDVWQKGHILGFEFAALVFTEGGSYGIDGGRISKLSLRNRKGRIVVSYDRGWDQRAKVWQPRSCIAVRLLLARFN